MAFRRKFQLCILISSAWVVIVCLRIYSHISRPSSFHTNTKVWKTNVKRVPRHYTEVKYYELLGENPPLLPVPWNHTITDKNERRSDEIQTSDNWPVLSKNYYRKPIPRSPYRPEYIAKWSFDVEAFNRQPQVKGQPPKLITWMRTPNQMIPLPEPVHLRMCPGMPCRLTTNPDYRNQSAALLWTTERTRGRPPPREHPDQVFIAHNNEVQKKSKYNARQLGPWRQAVNWTWTYRLDSDMATLYGSVFRRPRPSGRNYSQILARKTKLVAWMVSSCHTGSRREEYVRRLQRIIPVDIYGGCGPFKCGRDKDDVCTNSIEEDYKFYLAFENDFCLDYVTEKFFGMFNRNLVSVVRGGANYSRHAPSGTYIDVADFPSPERLAAHLLWLDSYPQRYLEILKAKDRYVALFEEWPIRYKNGGIFFMQYHSEAVGYCEICRRLWDLDTYRGTVPDLVEWFNKGMCYHKDDMGQVNQLES